MGWACSTGPEFESRPDGTEIFARSRVVHGEAHDPWLQTSGNVVLDLATVVAELAATTDLR